MSLKLAKGSKTYFFDQYILSVYILFSRLFIFRIHPLKSLKLGIINQLIQGITDFADPQLPINIFSTISKLVLICNYNFSFELSSEFIYQPINVQIYLAAFKTEKGNPYKFTLRVAKILKEVRQWFCK